MQGGASQANDPWATARGQAVAGPETCAQESANLLDSRFMYRTKLGDGFSLASFVLGIMAVTISMFTFTMGYYSGPGIFFPSVVFSISAIALGIAGARLQRLVTNRFGFGVAGAVLGFVALLTVVLAIMFTVVSPHPTGGLASSAIMGVVP